MYYSIKNDVSAVKEILARGIPKSNNGKIRAARRIVNEVVNPSGCDSSQFYTGAGVIISTVKSVEEFIDRFDRFCKASWTD
jgi:hypothetical protein